ncbi:MAG: S41 family peptidase [Woeseiaceae bacterium]|nr:S41 family peptidase [Woeseiaceae bacterium]
MSLKTRGILVVVIGTILGFSLSIGGDMLTRQKNPDGNSLSRDQTRLINEVLDRVRTDFVEPVDDTQLMDSAIRGMVSGLDRHSEFLDAEEYRDIRDSTSGNYSGVGLEVSTRDGAILVVAPIDDTPAHRAGIETGDEIIEIDGVSVRNDDLNEAIKKMRGRPGTPVKIRVRREHYDDPLTFYLTRQKIQVASVRRELIEPSYGYVRISQFNDSTADEVTRAIDEMNDEVHQRSGNMLSGLILDLRNNPGGILDAAIEVSDLFLDEGIIVTAQGRTPESQFRHDASLGDILDGGALVVLVNGGSASASEIVAGALKDHGRALVIGTTTFGKGLVQTVMPLSKGRAIKLTTSRYFTPSGESIHEVGIEPDIVVEGSGDFPALGSNSKPDLQDDAQLIEAIEQLGSRRVMHSQAD